MDEDPMEEFVVVAPANPEPVPLPAPAPVAKRWSPLPVPPFPPLPKSMEKKKDHNTNPQQIVTPTVPKANLRRARSLKSRDSSSSSLQLPPESADSVEPSSEIERLMQTMPRTPAPSALPNLSRSDARMNGLYNNLDGDSVDLLVNGTDPVVGGSSSTQKKMHWKTKEKMEKERKKALKDEAKAQAAGERKKGDVATGSQEGSHDDSNESMTTDSTRTESGKKKRTRKVYVSNHTPSGRKITPKDRWSPSPLHSNPPFASLQGTSPIENSSAVTTATSGASHNSAPSDSLVDTTVPVNIPSSSSLCPTPPTDAPKAKKPRYTGNRITVDDITKTYNIEKILIAYTEKVASRSGSQEAGPSHAVDDPELEPDSSDASAESQKKKRRKRGSRKPWNVKHTKKDSVVPRKTVRKENNQATKYRRRTQLDMLLDDPMAINDEGMGAQRTRKQINHFDATAPPPVAPQPSPVHQDSVDCPQGDLADAPLFADDKPMAPVLPNQAASSSTAGSRADHQPVSQNNIPEQVQHTPPTVQLPHVKEEVVSPAQQPPPAPASTPQQPALNIIRVKEEPMDSDCMIVSPPAAPSTSSFASSAAARSSRAGARAAARAGAPVPPPFAPAVGPGFAVPIRVNVDMAVEEWRTLYSQIDPDVLFLFHNEVTRYFMSLSTKSPPSQ